MLKLFLPCQIGSARLLHAATFTCKRSLCVALHVDDGPYDHCVCAARHDRQVELKWYWVEARRFVVLCEWCGTIHTCSMIFPWFSHDVPCRFVSWFGCHQLGCHIQGLCCQDARWSRGQPQRIPRSLLDWMDWMAIGRDRWSSSSPSSC